MKANFRDLFTDQPKGAWDGPFWSVLTGALLFVLVLVALRAIFVP